MIIGIGHDLTSIERIDNILNSKAGIKFLQRILTPLELEYANGLAQLRQAEFVAGRFAAKEAVSKAFGCGISVLLGFQDIEITKLPSGKPQCNVSQAALKRLGLREKNIVIHLSISHERHLASAYVIVEG